MEDPPAAAWVVFLVIVFASIGFFTEPPKGVKMSTKVNDIYSNYITHEDLGERGVDGVKVVVSKVEVVTLPDPKKGEVRKLAVHFERGSRPLLFCKTNAASVAELLGEEDAEKWVGREVTLITREVKMGPKTVKAIRIKMDPETYKRVEDRLANMHGRKAPWIGGPK